MLKKIQFEKKANMILPTNVHKDVGIITINDTQFSINGRYRFNKYAYEIVTDFEEYKRLDKALYIPPIPELKVDSVANVSTNESRNPIINNVIKSLHPEIEFYNESKLNVKCNTFIAYSDCTPDTFAVDYLFNYKAQRSASFIFYDFYSYLSDAKSILDIVDVFDGTYEKTQTEIYPNYTADIYTINLNSFNTVKWGKYLYWTSSSTGCAKFIKDKLFVIENYPKYDTVKDFFNGEIFNEAN